MKTRHLMFPLLLAVATAHTQAAPANDAAVLAKLAQQSAEVDEQRAIVSFVSPGYLFPDQDMHFTRRGQPDTAEKYRPLTAYDKPNGAKLGEVRMTHNQCVNREAPGCDADPAWYLQTTTGAPYLLAVREVTYMTEALLSFRDSVRDNGKVWSAIEYAKGTFWVATDADSVTGYETLATYTTGFDNWCGAPGACKPVDKHMRTELERMVDGTYQSNGCFAVAYDITGLVTAQGKQYYKVKLGAVSEGSKRPALPASGYIPVRNNDGSHAGKFEPDGC